MKINTQKYIVRKFENETIFLDVESGTSHILDDVATLMLEYFEKYKENDVVLERLHDFFHNADYAVIEKDYNKFVQELIEKDIIVYD